MGGCFSKKKVSSSSPPSSQLPPTSTSPSQQQQYQKKEASHQQQQQAAEIAVDKKHVFGITQNKQKQQQQHSNTAQEEVTNEEERVGVVAEKEAELPKKNPCGDGVMVEEARVVPVRISSCTKEEVDAILIQCGRLSRSSSGKTSNENGGRKYSGSKRSYDFDNEKKGEEEDWEKPQYQLRPSPHRRTHSRERDGGEYKRCGSRERGSGGGGRRVSRSPGKRSEGMAPPSSSSSADKSRVPGKMVSVPAREKGNAVAEAGGISAKRTPSAAATAINRRSGDVGGLRTASPRSRSPANNSRISNENANHNHPPPQQPQSLSRSSSRKADQSPCRRNPMSEIDENSLRAEQPLSRNQTHNSNNYHKLMKNKEGDDGARKPSHQQSQKANECTVQLRKSELRNGGTVETSNGSNSSNITMNRGVREQLMSCRMEQEPEIVEETVETKVPLKGLEVDILNPRSMSKTRSSRRSSRDLDMNLAFNPDNLLNQASYASLLLEDIQNYHQQKTTAVSLPACVSKACSILEAVADLNSSVSDNKSSEAGHAPSLHGRFSRIGLAKDPFVESEVVVKDDIMEPSLHKYVSVRDVGGEMEPQESAGSNSFIGQPWAGSSWEPNSTDSTDSYWNSQSNDGEEEVEKEEFISHGSQKALSDACDLENRGRRLRRSSTSNSLSAASVLTGKKKDFDQHQNRRGSSGAGGSGKVGVGRVSAPPAASVSASS